MTQRAIRETRTVIPEAARARLGERVHEKNHTLARRVAWVLALASTSALLASAPLRTTVAIPIPGAQTASSLLISANLIGDDFTIQSSPPAQADATVLTQATAVSGRVETLNDPNSGPPDEVVTHASRATSDVLATKGADLETGGSFSDTANLGFFGVFQTTAAAATAAEPLFSRAIASGLGEISGVRVVAAGGLEPLSTESSAVLNLELVWDVANLLVQTRSGSALALLQHTVNVIQLTDAGTSVTPIGFSLLIDNEKASATYFEAPGSTAVADWFADHLAFAPATSELPNTLVLNGAPDGFTTPLTLLDYSGGSPQEVELALISRHTELSFEAPPRAALQTAEKAGFKSPSDDQQVQLHWDHANAMLWFDPMPINVLTSENLDTVSPEYQNDPLVDGILEIDPLFRLAQFDGREFFSGDELRLISADGDVLLSASLPLLVFEPELSHLQGFNLFGPVLAINEIALGPSVWLEDYFSNLDFASLLLSELFIGFDTYGLGDDLWSRDFDAPVHGVLSFATTQVPEPSSLALLIAAFIVVMLKSVDFKCQISCGTSDKVAAQARFIQMQVSTSPTDPATAERRHT